MCCSKHYLYLAALALKVSAFASTCWEKPLKEKKQKNKKDTTYPTEQNYPAEKQFYTNREDYMSTLTYFIGSEEAMPKIIENGCFNYTFSVRLPENGPSSFHGTCGEVRYELNVFIDFPDYRQCFDGRTLTVQAPYDLRTEIAQLICKYDMEVVENKSCTKFWQRQIQLHVNVPQIGYIPGEQISIYVKILNYNKLKLTDCIYKLNLIATYTGRLKKKTKVRVERMNLSKIIHSLSAQTGNVVQHLQTLHVPETPSSTVASQCKYIQLNYEVEVILHTSDKKRWLSAQIPIHIGTISLSTHRDFDGNMSHNEMAASTTPTLFVARSTSDLSKLQLNAANEMEPTAPSPDTTTIYASTYSLTPPFRDAEHMNRTNSNQLDFKPNYIYYDAEEDKRL